MSSPTMKTEDILQSAERVFGTRVDRIIAPGGKRRGSYRVEMPGRSVIVSRRDVSEQTKYEAMVLEALQAHTDATAQFLGLDGSLMFQSDVGGTRLSQHIHASDENHREEIAVKAVRSLFDVHCAGRMSRLRERTHALGASAEWVEAFVQDAGRVHRKLGFAEVDYDRDGLCDFIGLPEAQFIKWDCRSGNAAVDETGTIRWFDFEYSGVRHGAEDFAWLIGDECWPVDAETMVTIVAQEYGRMDTRPWAEYRAYLEVYSALHCIQRLLQIISGVRRKGWISQERALHYDDVGINPHFAIQLCSNGAYLSAQNSVSAGLVEIFEQARTAFEGTL